MLPVIIYAQKNKIKIDNQRLRDTMDPFLLPAERFIERYRIPPHLVIKLIEEIYPYIPDDVEGAIPLVFYGGGGYQRLVGTDGFNMMSQSKVSQSINEISRVLTGELGPEYIKFPQSHDEIDMIKERFFEDYEIEGVIGIVGGTQISIAGLPLSIRNSYISHKVRKPTINTQIVIDSDMRVLHVNARYRGSADDTLVWHNSKVFKRWVYYLCVCRCAQLLNRQFV